MRTQSGTAMPSSSIRRLLALWGRDREKAGRGGRPWTIVYGWIMGAGSPLFIMGAAKASVGVEAVDLGAGLLVLFSTQYSHRSSGSPVARTSNLQVKLLSGFNSIFPVGGEKKFGFLKRTVQV